MSGFVYVFNCFNEPVSKLSVAGYNAGGIAAASDGSTGNPPKYTPAQLKVPRVKDQGGDDAAFAYGDNDLGIPWDSFHGKTTVTIPSPSDSSPVSINTDLTLLLGENLAILAVAETGFVLSSSKVTTTAA